MSNHQKSLVGSIIIHTGTANAECIRCRHKVLHASTYTLVLIRYRSERRNISQSQSQYLHVMTPSNGSSLLVDNRYMPCEHVSHSCPVLSKIHASLKCCCSLCVNAPPKVTMEQKNPYKEGKNASDDEGKAGLKTKGIGIISIRTLRGLGLQHLSAILNSGRRRRAIRARSLVSLGLFLFGLDREVRFADTVQDRRLCVGLGIG